MPRRFRFTVADVFTDVPLAGNPLAVFTDARDLPEALLQPLARELGFSEVVFCYPPAAGGHARLRIFTPAAELPFAGHPVLGTAFVLGGPLQLAELHLETAAAVVSVALEREGARIVFGRMSQPLPSVRPYPQAAALLPALGLESSPLPLELYDNGTLNVYFLLHDEGAVAGLEPDLAALRRLTSGDPLPSLHAVCAAGAGPRWRVRMFAPADGVPEDPATGSAAGPLACWLGRHGLAPLGTELVISQGAELGRPSTLHARADGRGGLVERVEVGGAAVIVARGEFLL